MQLKTGKSKSGYALLTTLVFVGIGLALLASVTTLTSTQSRLTGRNNLYNSTVAAAEAASEMVIAQMNRDFTLQSVNSDLGGYRVLTPTSIQSNWPVKFAYANGSGTAGQIGVQSLGPAMVTNLNSQFAGLYGLVMPFRVTARAAAIDSAFDVAATVQQDIQLASIPVFQFAIFYAIDLELNPGPVMTVNGKVHSNAGIYTAPGSGLTYKDSVTAVGKILNDRHLNDPQYGAGKVAPVYKAQHTEKVSALTLPIGVDNDPAAVQGILEVPPVNEDPASTMGKQRYYNKADLIVTTTSSGVQLKSGHWNLLSNIKGDVTNGTTVGYSFIKTLNKTMFDLRENKWVSATEIDVAKLKDWLQNPNGGKGINDSAKFNLGHGINSIYVEDQRDDPSRLEAVRVVNGEVLPADGLTIATEFPIYVKGHYNLNNGSPSGNQSDTSNTKPASLVGDSITIVSKDYDDSNAAQNVKTGRAAANTTVNAALLGGIVKTMKENNNTKHYSGGAENFIRLLENWAGKTLTYNGSIVVLFESQYGTNFWKDPSVNNYYTAPTRNWSFDVNFLDQAKLPPGTPQVRKLVRGQWNVVAQ